MNSTTLIYPMAGKGTRFGGTFKPFLEVNSHATFIELSMVEMSEEAANCFCFSLKGIHSKFFQFPA